MHSKFQVRLLTLKEVPSWFDANPFILTGYRPESQSWRQSLASWLYLHNETGNIYSHLLPGVFLLLGLLSTITGTWNKLDLYSLDDFMIALPLAAATICLLISTLYHTSLNHSEHVAHCWLQCDYGGILVLILGNFVSGLHFGFYCTPALRTLYWSLITASTTGTGIFLLSPWFREPEWRPFRLFSCIATGLFALAPITHAGYLWGVEYLIQIGVPYYLLEGVFLLAGCYVFQTRFPESSYPGRFDIWGNSHTLWHILVALSIFAHMGGLLSARDNSYRFASCSAGL